MAATRRKAHDVPMEPTTTHSTVSTRSRRFERPREDRVLAGVASGIAAGIDVSVGAVRIAFLVTSLFAGFGLVAYATAWAIMPAAGEDETAAQRWWHDIRTPGKRLGAALIGLIALILLAPFAPGLLLLAAAVVIAASLFTNRHQTTKES